jgi:hypothetical protein
MAGREGKESNISYRLHQCQFKLHDIYHYLFIYWKKHFLLNVSRFRTVSAASTVDTHYSTSEVDC